MGIAPADAQSAAVARKRRVELLKMTRAANISPVTSVDESSVPYVVMGNPEQVTSTTKKTGTKKRKVSDASESKTKKKRPTQMRYDPDVPMTKEEAAAWRREARKIRNRNSAAASRQKTRDRIEELEAEVQSWQEKYAALEAKVKAYEYQNVVKVLDNVNNTSNTISSTDEQSRSLSSMVSSQVSDIVMESAAALIGLSPVLSATAVKTKEEGNASSSGTTVTEQHLNMISRPAVKIADVVQSSSTPVNAMPLLPEFPAVSEGESESDVVVGSDASTEVITDEECEDLDEFLMDAFAIPINGAQASL